jgi:hypothetical protein
LERATREFGAHPETEAAESLIPYSSSLVGRFYRVTEVISIPSGLRTATFCAAKSSANSRTLGPSMMSVPRTKSMQKRACCAGVEDRVQVMKEEAIEVSVIRPGAEERRLIAGDSPSFGRPGGCAVDLVDACVHKSL